MKQKLVNPLSRFNSKFVIDSITSCWIWIGSKRDVRGYGQFSVKRKNLLAHRFGYENYVGPIPKDMTLDHLCKNTSCVNPLHLEIVSRNENARRGNNEIAKNDEKTYCKKGHPYSGENLYNRPNGERDCHRCHAESQRKYLTKKKRGVDVP